ncbi:MAG: hypothetical protein ACU0BB_07290 [Paracoccaceae bacterium]
MDLTEPPASRQWNRPGLFAGLGATCGWLVAALTQIMIGTQQPDALQSQVQIITSGATAAPIVLLLGLSQRRTNPNLTWFGICYALGLAVTLTL